MSIGTGAGQRHWFLLPDPQHSWFLPTMTEVFLHRFRRGGAEPGGQPEEGAGGAAGGQVPEEADVLQGSVGDPEGFIPGF